MRNRLGAGLPFEFSGFAVALLRSGMGLMGLVLIALLAGCETPREQPEIEARRAMLREMVTREKPGDYFIGRRYFKNDYKMWGWVRRPGQPWSEAQLVMLNEQRCLAPDRAQGTLGVDNNHEYKLKGYFSGDTVYEPASNRFYPEFVLLGYELVDSTPPLIFADRRSLDPAIRLLDPPL